MSLRSGETNLRLLKTWGFDVIKIVAKLHWLPTKDYKEQHICNYRKLSVGVYFCLSIRIIDCIMQVKFSAKLLL